MEDSKIKELEAKFNWEPDPLVFAFNAEIPGKVRMHTKRLDMDDWVKIDCTYPAQMKLRQKLLKEQMDETFVSDADEATMFAKHELLEKLVDYLPKRFPDLFESREGGIYNKVFEEFVSSDINDPEDPILRCGRLTQEDWVIISHDKILDSFKLTAGVVYFPMRWSLQEKYRKGIPAIHQPVQSFQKHLKNNVQSLFARMSPGAPVWRSNWAVFNDLRDPLDLYTPIGHTDRNEVNQVTEYQGEATGSVLTFRAEYQTLVKLPKSGAIVFSIRTYQRFMTDFWNVPLSDVIGLITAIETLDADNYVYKGAEFWDKAALAYLRNIVTTKEPSSSKSQCRIGYLSLNAKSIAALGVVVCGVAVMARYLLRSK